MIFCGKGLFDWDNELGKDWKKLIGAFFDQFISALTGQKFIGLFDFSETFKENGQVKMVIQLFRFHFPCELNR